MSKSQEVNLIEFSFCDHKAEFDKYLHSNDYRNAFIENFGDFWKFVNKYEQMLKSAGQMLLKSPLMEYEFFNFQPYHKQKCVPFVLCEDLKKKKDKPKNSQKDEPLKVKQFKEIIMIYLDFKQKEKFMKIKKLRKAQKSLPMARFKNILQDHLKESRVIIIAGDTGCGKSTQVPQYLYEFGFKSIACTQPRRLACVSLSKRVAHEMLEDYGSKVGFQIRFEKNRTSKTNILFITEGLLLRQLAIESNLSQYDVLMLDEIHERNLHSDFLLGVTKCLLRANTEMKLILMSATINVNLFYDYFKEDGAKLLQVPGRLFPIKVHYRPPPSLQLQKNESTKHSNKTSSGRLDPGPFIQVLSLIDQKYETNERGDVLIFVSGVNEITTVCDAIKEYAEQNSHWIVLPLHSQLSLAEQDKVFDYAPDGMRKCIVSTNIAETSVTVDGVRFVLDSGKVKEMSYDSSCKGQRLKEFWVSKASAEQRKGRAGRTGPGICYRLYSEKQYESFESFSTPEIFRVPLDTILLQMIAMGLPNVRTFPFIESPAEENIEQTILSLKQHSVLMSDEKITPLGRSLSSLPVDISIGKMLLMGSIFTDFEEKILTLAAVISVQNPFTSRAFSDRKCEQQREDIESDQGDIFTILRAFREWLYLKRENESSRSWCYKLGIEEQRFYEVTKLRNQFRLILENSNLIQKQSSTTNPSSSSERAKRHGEVRMLKAIKRQQTFQEPRKRKVLKQSVNPISESDSQTDFEDIRNVDFHLRHNSAKLLALYNSASLHKHRDMMLSKLVIVSGFYPQIAIADDFNFCKGGSQQFFHTCLKPFISIHPNGYFAKNFNILRLNDSDILEKPSYYTPKQILSTKHQILCYQNLLETVKPYLMNCIRMPAAQTLLLFSYSIDTNENVSQVVCDSWLNIDFPVPETGAKLLCKAIKLRRQWSQQMSQKLNELSNVSEETKSETKVVVAADSSKGEQFIDSLVDFMNTNVAYTLKRLLPADMKNLYTQHNISNYKKLTSNPFDEDFALKINEEKGGVFVADNVVYGCLRELQWTMAMDNVLKESVWTCKLCGFQSEMETVLKLLHEKHCSAMTESPKRESISKKEDVVAKSEKGTEYFCDNCEKTLYLSQINLLKHKKYCNRNKTKD